MKVPYKVQIGVVCGVAGGVWGCVWGWGMKLFQYWCCHILSGDGTRQEGRREGNLIHNPGMHKEYEECGCNII